MKDNSPSRAAGHSRSVHRVADRAGTIADGQGSWLSNSVSVGAMGDLSGSRAVRGVCGDDFGGVSHVAGNGRTVVFVLIVVLLIVVVRGDGDGCCESEKSSGG